MRKLRLIRHAKVEMPEGGRRYIGVTDLMLSEAGVSDAGLLGTISAEMIRDSSVYTSPLSRCVRTAQELLKGAGLSPFAYEVSDGLREIDLGKWEMRLQEDIAKEAPEDYRRRREEYMTFRTPGGETFKEAADRFRDALDRIRAETEGDILIVTHAGVIRSYLVSMFPEETGDFFSIRHPSLGITTLIEDEGKLKLHHPVASRRHELLTDREIRALYRHYDTPRHVIDHMRAVADTVDEILEGVDGKEPYIFDHDLIRKAALLHDLLRLEKHHAKASADAVRREGYDDVADLILAHEEAEDAEKTDRLTAREILYYADKITKETERVTIAERFEKSLEKCKTAEALAAHDRRHRQALWVEGKIIRMEQEKTK